MRSIVSMDTVQVEITTACMHSCSNCTRFCGYDKSWFMSFDQFKQAIDSMAGYPKMTGMMGGEPLLHPEFERFCEYMVSKIPREKLGLWTCLPVGYEQHAEVIVKTFGNLFHNDHSRDDIYHHPVLVGVEEVYKDPQEMFFVVDNCWAQLSWSASINPRGAFFCEIAAAMSIMFNEPDTTPWSVEPGWWWRTPKDFKAQIERWCPRCGFPLPLERRSSRDGRDDISPLNLQRLRGKSKKIDAGKYVESQLILVKEAHKMAAYKDMHYRQRIAATYGIGIELNEKRFLNPYLLKDRPKANKLLDHYRSQAKEVCP